MRQISMLNLAAEYELFADEVRQTAISVLDSQRFVGGPAVGELEQALRTRVGSKHAIAVSSGTDALLCTLMAMGIGPGDEVLLPTFTFFATAGVVARVGAKPVFVDIDPRTFNIDPGQVETLLTRRTKAIVVVHLFGQCAEMDEINAIARKHGLKVIEDAAQAIGATYRKRNAGTLADASCLSFYPTKNLGGFGEGGMIFTNDQAMAELVVQLRNHGQSRSYFHDHVGGNFRLDTMKAAILLVKLKHLEDFTRRRQVSAQLYNEHLLTCDVATPFIGRHQTMVYHQYSILSDRRDQLKTFLGERGVGCGIYYPIPLHRQPCFASMCDPSVSLPVSERTCARILSLPCHPMLSEEDVTYVTSTIAEFCGSTSSTAVSVGGESASATAAKDG